MASAGRCSENRDCCFSTCRSGRCWYGGGDGSRCGGQRCQDGWRCCNSSGVSVCVPQNYPVCCGNQSFVNGYTCCGGSGGACLGGIDSCTGQFGVCCQSGWKHCNSGFFAGQCIPNNWSCDDLSQSNQSAGISVESTEEIPTSAPEEIPPCRLDQSPAVAAARRRDTERGFPVRAMTGKPHSLGSTGIMGYDLGCLVGPSGEGRGAALAGIIAHTRHARPTADAAAAWLLTEARPGDSVPGATNIRDRDEPWTRRIERWSAAVRCSMTIDIRRRMHATCASQQ